MPAHLVPHWIRIFAATLLALAFASAPHTARAASVLSDGGVTPTSGTTATTLTFNVLYTSTDSPRRPAQAVWAQVGNVTVTLTKVSGSAHDGTWQGTATLPAGTWRVTFHATNSGDVQPEPLPGPLITVTQAPTPTAPPVPAPQPPSAPTSDEDPTLTATPTSAPTPSVSGSERSRTPVPTPRPITREDDNVSSGRSDAPAADRGLTTGRRVASLLIIGSSISLIGAVVLARQFLRRPARAA